jgi:TetR/AcrR family transcriptional regulator, transcriptional repressor for nem operon
MARPREFGEGVVLDAAVRCFWARGYDSKIGQGLGREERPFRREPIQCVWCQARDIRTALDHYIESSIGARIRRCETLPARDAIRSFFDAILRRSLNDRERKGCMLVTSARRGAS